VTKGLKLAGCFSAKIS